jgi:hypothetical protein
MRILEAKAQILRNFISHIKIKGFLYPINDLFSCENKKYGCLGDLARLMQYKGRIVPDFLGGVQFALEIRGWHQEGHKMNRLLKERKPKKV